MRFVTRHGFTQTGLMLKPQSQRAHDAFMQRHDIISWIIARIWPLYHRHGTVVLSWVEKWTCTFFCWTAFCCSHVVWLSLTWHTTDLQPSCDYHAMNILSWVLETAPVSGITSTMPIHLVCGGRSTVCWTQDTLISFPLMSVLFGDIVCMWYDVLSEKK